MNVTKLSGYMAFTLLIGAANADADDYQRNRLRAELLPLLEDTKHWNGPAILQTFHDIMGPSWKPKGEWASAIENFTEN